MWQYIIDESTYQRDPTISTLNSEGVPETIKENNGIRRFIWEHVPMWYRIGKESKRIGAISPNKSKYATEVVIEDRNATEDDASRIGKVDKILIGLHSPIDP